MPSKLKICILSELAYSLLIGKSSYIGGAELQMTTLAKELADRSYDVSFVTFVKTNNPPELIKNIKIYHPFNYRGSGYTYLYPHNMYKLLKILNKIDADIYIHRTTTPLTGLLAFFAKLKNKIFFYSASSDEDVSVNLVIRNFKDLKKIFYKFGVKNCDCVLCQTFHQKKLLKQTINKEGKILKNLYLPPKKKYNKKVTTNLKVLWVGRITKWKRPELFLRLAKEIPDFNFWMIGSPSKIDPEYYNQIKEDARRIKNLEFIGLVPHEKIEKYYEESSLLINLSSGEGFPNTFLEAWGNYTPVVSLSFDPDGIINKYGLGVNSKKFDDLVKSTYMLLKDKNLRKKMGNQGRKYVEKEHNIGKIINEYEKIFWDFKMKKNIICIR